MNWQWLLPWTESYTNNPATYLVCVGAAVVVVGIAKAGFGGGIGVLAVPLMALAMGSKEMLGLLLPVLIACDVLSNLHYIGAYEWRLLPPLLIGAVVGVVIGYVLLWWLGGQPPGTFNQIMGLTVGLICLAVVAMQLYRQTGRELPTLPTHPLSGGFIGCLAGAVSTISHSAGPIVTIYMLQERVEKRKLVGTLLVYFLLINCVKVPGLVMLNIINRQTLHDSIWFIPLIPVGTLTGAWLHKKINPKPFVLIMYIGAAASAFYLIYKALIVAPVHS